MDGWARERVGRYRPKVPQRVPRAIPDQLFNALFTALPSNRDRALVAFWISTGMRASELLGVRQCDIDPGQQLITVVRKGTRAAQQVPASADAFVWLRLYQEELHGQIPRGRTQPVWWTLRRPRRPLNYHAAHRMFERANAALGSNWTLHDLRHSAAARMARDPQLTLSDVQLVMGHAHLSTTEIYLTPNKDEVIAGVLAHHARTAEQRENPVPPPPALMRVRALYLDIAHWAVDDPARWGPWVAPCPISGAEVQKAKERRHRKARMDQRTRERLPVLPVLVRTANDRRLAAARLLAAAQATESGEVIDGTDGRLRRAIAPKAIGRLVWAEDVATGKRRNLSYEDEEAFWAFATIEVLRLNGIRCEELLELSHHSITEYRLPSTGELVPLLQIAPSKTDTERLLLVSPELADVLSAIVQRLRAPDGSVPLVVSHDVREKIWHPPMPLLFQRGIGNERRAFTPSAIRKLLINALAATELADANGNLLMFQAHDFRRIFVTDAIMNGLPPHIAQVICRHKTIDTTMGYKAVYPAETIEAHRAFIARRRATRPSEEYRTPTGEEWNSFLVHFEKRKVSVGTCARAFGSPCVHEHACVRCSLLRPDPAQRARLEEIRDNLEARIIEAKREGWLGEVEGLQVSYSGVKDKLAQIEAVLRKPTATELGMPSFNQVSGRASTTRARRHVKSLGTVLDQNR